MLTTRKHTRVLFSRLEESAIFMAHSVFAVGKAEMYFTLAQFHEQ